jgi:hypothetical protein
MKENNKMAQFNLADYETVEQRIARFYKDQPDGRIITHNLTTPQDRAVLTWVVQTIIYLSGDDQARGLAKATGLAFEIDGTGGANKTSALENAETSSIGRALANANYSGNRRTTREEMAKVERGQTPATGAWTEANVKERDAIIKQISAVKTKDELRAIWTENVATLDWQFTNSLGDTTSLKELIMSRNEELVA